MQPSPFAHPGRFAKLKQWFHSHPKAKYFVAAGILLAVAAVITAIALLQPQQAVVKKTPAKPTPPPVYYAPLTGNVVDREAMTTLPVTAIMLENSPDARPQSGLKAAEIVYEAVAEGGITRFLAVYQQNKPSLIGPVRSLREYYVDWLTPYNASVAHVGGSYKALQIVQKGSYRDIDQFFNAGAYYRATDRYAPHNVYTTWGRLSALNKSKGYVSSSPKSFSRVTTPTKLSSAKKMNAKRIQMSISSPTFNPSYAFDAKTGLYLRSQAGAPHVDREKGRITAKVVVAMIVNMKAVFEDGYRESITTSGKGTAYVFQNGTVKKVTWQKRNRNAQLRLIDTSGNDMKLEQGTTWISAIPKDGGSVTWK
jgi:hypothetical protein